MSQALYRKYRPQTFSEVIGQEHIKQTLINQLKGDKISHAYLFCGPRGIGKTTLARLIAKSANCLDLKDGEPCNQCKNCKNINSNKALDIVEIDAASHTGVDNVRENIINNAQVSSSVLKYKVFIIDEIHMLSASAFNALLKTLEEPPKNVIFILATTEIHKVPATIISRCQKYDFKKVPLKEIVGKLEKIVISENIKVDLIVLQRIAKNSEGCARDAESLLGQIIALDENHITKEIAELALPKTELSSIIEFFKLLVNKQSKPAIALINQLVENGVDLNEFNRNLIEFLRKILLYRITGNLSELEYLDIDGNAHQEIISALGKIGPLDIKKLIEIFILQIDPLKSSPIIQLPLELAVVEICEESNISATYDTNLSESETKKKVQKIIEIPTQPVEIKEITQPPAFKNGSHIIASQPSEQATSQDQPDEQALADIQSKLPAIIKALRIKNHSLALTLSISQLVAFDKNNTLTIGVKYKFHSDRICEPENLAIIESVLEEQLQRPVKVICVVDAKYEDKKLLQKINKSDNLDNVSEQEVDNVWDLAVNAFNAEHSEEVTTEENK